VNPIGVDMTTSRYYLPPNPGQRANCPWFKSQTMLSSLSGPDRTCQEEVVLLRVAWNAFTPRFMHENKRLLRSRKEYVLNWTKGAQQASAVAFRGPFDTVQYNLDLYPTKGKRTEASLNKPDPALGVMRPTPLDYGGQSHSTRGIEVQLLDGDALISDVYDDSSGSMKKIADATFKNPDLFNRVGTSLKPVKVRADRLRYKLIFRYPVDPLVDPGAGTADDRGGRSVNPAQHYLLDTPVFDDISIAYMGRVRVLAYRPLEE
jgi:hypothetical protein